MTLKQSYQAKKIEIKNRLGEFQSNKKVFEELCFCLCTPQTNAHNADNAIKELGNKLKTGSKSELVPILKKNGVRFHNTKAQRIVEARKLKLIYNRDWLVKNVNGLGLKEASHFLRNIGKGKNMAILDRHILKNLKKYKVIKTIPKTLSKTKYLEIEQKMQKFSKKIKIPMQELDLLFWSKETGEVFK